MTEQSTAHSFCRACANCCPTIVDIEDGRLVRVEGDPVNPTFDGYSCIKGRVQPELHNHPDRLLHSLKRQPDGTYVPIDTETAMDEIAEAVRQLVGQHGPRAFSAYVGTAGFANCLTDPFVGAFLHALGSKMKFSPNTIDKPGKSLALAMHGRWMAPPVGYHEPDVALLIGANPFKTYFGVACGHPTKWLTEQMDRGMDLLVIDPRRSDIAKRATLHLQPRPGHDPAILACLLKVILDEELFDREFVHENARGLDELREAVSPFTAEAVGERAGVDPEHLRELARRFSSSRRGYVACGVGPGFAKSSTLVEYLALLLETLCGHWLRAGEQVRRMPTLLPAGPYRAQASDPTPAYGLGEEMRVGGLTQTTAGLPIGVLADEMLLEGPGRVRALFSFGGNPATAWPDQIHTVDALRSLDLLVQFDAWMSATAQLADYVIATPMGYEAPGMTSLTDFVIALPTWYGPAEAHAQYTDAVVAPPAGSDVISEWEFVYGLAQRLGLSLHISGMSLTPEEGNSGIAVDMQVKPSEDELFATLTADARVPLAEVKRHESGALFPDPPRYVDPKEPGWVGRFDLANSDMMRDLGQEVPLDDTTEQRVQMSKFPFRLINFRVAHMNNSTVNNASTNRGRSYNPAFMHPNDLGHLGLASGDEVEIASARASIRSIVLPDPNLREGLVAMAHGYGANPDDDRADDDRFREVGSPTSRLLDAATFSDPYVGMPQIGNIPVSVRRTVAAG